MPPEKIASFDEPHPIHNVGFEAQTHSANAYWELTKPRLSMMSVITALLGYLAAGFHNLSSLMAVFIGTALAAGGAAALNMWWERDEDALMHRTSDRPLPMSTVSPTNALIFGIFLSIVGPGMLWFGSNALAGLLAAITIVTYVLLYTPMKKVTPWSTEIGALPGAIPPLIGWVAAAETIGWFGIFLFAVLYVWQLPHFMAISWLHREDYALSGFRMLSVEDPTGESVSRRGVIWSAPLIVLTLMAWIAGECSWLFLIGGTLLSAIYFKDALAMLRSAERGKAAKRLFLSSIIFLPSYLLLMVVDRVLF